MPVPGVSVLWRRLVELQGSVTGWRIALESAGGCDRGALPLHEEPEDKGSEDADSSEASYDTSSDSTRVRPPSFGIGPVCAAE